MTQIVKESAPTFVTGQRAVGTSEVALAPVNLQIFKSVTVKADPDNNNWIRVGRRGAASHGFPLLAGEETPPLYVDETDKVGVIAGGANQSVTFLLS